MNTGFSDAALLLIGHGSTLNRDSSTPVFQHGAELRARKIFTRVVEGFYKEQPSIRAALAGISVPRVFAVPMCVSQGYFSEEVIPVELGLRQPGEATYATVQRRNDQVLFYSAPVGTHESMTDLILARAHQITAQFPFPRAPKPLETTLFIAGHGTERNENSRRAIERQVERIRALGVYGSVHAVFMEEEPRIAHCYELAQTRHIVMVPFFMSDGLHSNEDIPILLGEPERVVRQRLQNGQPTWRNPTEKHGKLIWYTRSIGTEPHLADIILERVQQAARLGVGAPRVSAAAALPGAQP